MATIVDSNQRREEERLVKENLGLVRAIVKKFKPHVSDYEDYYQSRPNSVC